MKKKSLDKVIREELSKAPKIDGFTIPKLAKITKTPYPPEYWKTRRRRGQADG